MTRFIQSLFICSLIMVFGCKKNDPTPTEESEIILERVDPTDPNICYLGRIDFSDSTAPSFCHSGVSVMTNFHGKKIQAIIADPAAGGAQNTNYYLGILDGGADTVVFSVSPSDTLYTLFDDLADVEHSIQLFKRTECSVGISAFKGFMIPEGTSLSEYQKPTRKIEFIGDSQTCGYGNLVSINSADNPTTGFNSVNEDNYWAWGAITARDLDAQYMCVAYSGRGMYRNNTGATIGTLPLIYDKIFPDDGSSPTWNTNDYTPDVIVINLGTNDFAPEAWSSPSMVDSAQFVNTYMTFVYQLRSYYSDAEIICVTGVMMSDYWPVGFQSWTRIQNYTEKVVEELNNAGDSKVHYHMLTPQTEPYGEDWHPTVNTHVQMSASITTKIQSITGW